MRFKDFALLEQESVLQSGPPFPPEDADKVKSMQSLLQRVGYSVGSTGIDGKYGPRTARAVRAFKNDYKLQGNGQSVSAKDIETMNAVGTGKIKRVEKPTSTGGPKRTELGKLRQDAVTKGKVGKVLDLIASVESAGKYDAVYPGRVRSAIVNMTLDELFQDMRKRGKATGSSASGRYQYIRKTLQGVARQMGLDTRKEKFTPELQDEIAIFHLRSAHGLDRWLDGRMSDEAFLNKLAGTWAGIPNTGGISSYAGVLDNEAGTSTDVALNTLQSIKGTA